MLKRISFLVLIGISYLESGGELTSSDHFQLRNGLTVDVLSGAQSTTGLQNDTIPVLKLKEIQKVGVPGSCPPCDELVGGVICLPIPGCTTGCQGDQVEDCNGVCGGSATLDCAGNCGGNATVDCDGNCGGNATVDCAGNCGGNATVDCAGNCGGNATVDCAGNCGGNATVDCAGNCGGNATVDCAGNCGGNATVDCAGNCGGSATVDCAGNCGGNATVDCAGNCGGNATVDCAGNCGGNATVDCAGNCGGNATVDCAGNCGGNATVDCAGNCGGNATVDCAGNCGGNATVDCAGNCGGNATVDCAGNCGGNATVDCAGNCGGNATVDCAGNCGGNATVDCAGNCGGNATVDCAGNCGGNATVDCAGNCAGNCGGNATVDCAGNCGGNATVDCAGNCGGNATVDCAGNCGGNATVDCAGNCGGNATVDCAGNCGGNATVDCAGNCGGNATVDCAGNCGGNATVDCAGNCGGNATVDCAGNCGGNATVDCAGNCGGNATVDCAGNCGGNATVDCAGNCGGNATVDCAGNCGGSAVDLGCGCNQPAPDCAGNCGGSAVDLGCGCNQPAPDCAGNCGGSVLPASACDDQDPCTINDTHDSSCNCNGTPLLENIEDLLTTPNDIICIYDNPMQLNTAFPEGTFTGNGVTSSSGLFDPEIAGQGPHTITYEYVSEQGCTLSHSISILVENVVNGAELNEILVCPGDTAIMAAGGISSNVTGPSIEWSGGFRIGDPTTQIQFYGATQPGTYTVTLTYEACTFTKTFVVIQDELCDPLIDTLGCIDSTAINFDTLATTSDNSCIYCSDLTIDLPGLSYLCEGESLTIEPTSNREIISYTWRQENGDVMGTDPTMTVTGASTQIFGQIDHYSLEVTDEHGCTKSENIDIAVIPVLQLTLTVQTGQCGQDPSIFIESDRYLGGVLFEISLDDGDTYTIPDLAGDSTYTLSAEVGIVQPKVRWVTVSDPLGCFDITLDSIEVLPDSLGCSDPDCGSPVIVEIIDFTDVESCPFDKDGKLQITATGSNLQYSIDGQNYQNSNIIQDLDPGNYTVYVRNSETLCEAMGSATITANDCPEICNNNIDDDSDGLIDCFDSDCITSDFEIKIVHIDTCATGQNGSITVCVDTTGYEFSIDGQNFQSDSVFSNLPSGLYTITGRNTNGGCSFTHDVTLGEVGECSDCENVSISINGEAEICSGTSATLTLNGQVDESTILWNNGASTVEIVVSQAGTYAVNATVNGCPASAEFTVVASSDTCDTSCIPTTVNITTSENGFSYSEGSHVEDNTYIDENGIEISPNGSTANAELRLIANGGISGIRLGVHSDGRDFGLALTSDIVIDTQTVHPIAKQSNRFREPLFNQMTFWLYESRTAS